MAAYPPEISSARPKSGEFEALFQGVFAALVTPFDATLRVDTTQFQRVVHYAVDAGCAGLLVGGHTGEHSSLDPDEMDLLVRTAREVVRGRVPVVQGVYAESTGQAIARAHRAKANGADALLIIPPWLFGFVGEADGDAVVQFYRDVTNDVAMPCLAFCYGPAYGFYPSVVAAIARLPNIVGLKVGGPLHHYEACVNAVDGAAALLCCADSNLYGCLSVGGEGAMAALASIAPHWCVEMFACLRRGDVRQGRAINALLFQLVQFVFEGSFLRMPLRAKTVLDVIGVLDGAFSRPPVQPLPVEEKAALTRAAHATGLYSLVHDHANGAIVAGS